jgi:magnesium transporter
MATAVEFDFGTKQERPIALDEARAACEQGRHCWIDLDATDRAAADAVLRGLGVNATAIEESLDSRVDGRYDVYEDCLHLAVAATSFQDSQICTSHVDVIVADQFIVTLHRGPVEFLDQVRRTYQKDFVRFAKTLSFLLYEIWDHLIDSYTRVMRRLEDEVESVQAQIVSDADDEIFGRVAASTRELLSFRKLILTAREVLHELATRRSPFVSESTQPYLDNMVGKLERLGSDLTVEREILAETLNLYMGIVSHRTSRLVSRLTVVSLIFLPLTFLCGVYGMNFEFLPETKWKYGYLFFWSIAALIAGGLLAIAKRKRWL